MDIKGKFPNGLKKIMAETGVKPAQLARDLDTSRQNVKRWQDQTRKIPPEFAVKIAKHFDRTLDEVVFPGLSGVTKRVRLLSLIRAGSLSPDEIRQADIGSVIIADLPKGEWIAFKVEGDSMDRISPPDSVILVNRKEKRLVPNACYVIVDGEGNSTYKRYRPNPMRFDPVSTNANLPSIFPDGEPEVFGRVRRTMLDM